jgi:hypothetical protein
MSEPKRTLANIRFQCGFGFDIRFSRCRGEIEANVKSTTLANRGPIGADASSVKVLRPRSVAEMGVLRAFSLSFLHHTNGVFATDIAGSFFVRASSARVFPVYLKSVQPIVRRLFCLNDRLLPLPWILLP